jgi:uncharacterized membrane protein YecN with MAPEG domain
MKKRAGYLIIGTLLLMSCSNMVVEQGVKQMIAVQSSDQQLLREAYRSSVDQSQREYFVYLPRGYHSEPEKNGQ